MNANWSLTNAFLWPQTALILGLDGEEVIVALGLR